MKRNALAPRSSGWSRPTTASLVRSLLGVADGVDADGRDDEVVVMLGVLERGRDEK